MAEVKNDAVANAKKHLEEDRKLREQSAAEYAEASKGKPTPTQEENDLAMLGGHVTGEPHEEDGSNPDSNIPPPHAGVGAGGARTRQMESGKPAPYQTKAPEKKE